MIDRNDVIQTRLEDLRRRFVLRMFQDRDVLAQAWEMRDYQTIFDYSHKLSGIAGSFGYADVGDAAEELQNMLEASADDLLVGTSLAAVLNLIDSCK